MAYEKKLLIRLNIVDNVGNTGYVLHPHMSYQYAHLNDASFANVSVTGRMEVVFLGNLANTYGLDHWLHQKAYDLVHPKMKPRPGDLPDGAIFRHLGYQINAYDVGHPCYVGKKSCIPIAFFEINDDLGRLERLYGQQQKALASLSGRLSARDISRKMGI